MNISEQSSHYYIHCPVTGKNYSDEDWLLDSETKEPSLLQSVYKEKQLILKGEEYGLYTYASWLPVKRFLQGSSAPVTYKSTGLAAYLGLQNLYITFSGYWPEKGAQMQTCSFKETEAYSVGARLNTHSDKILVVASAGNTARSFARVCSDNHIPLLICIPEENMDAMWFDRPLDDCIKIAATSKGSDYYDAIHLSNLICQIEGFIPEGGAKNIARRDGMGTTVLSAATTIGSIPDYYFQAVGSGTGAIAAWEANLRLIEDGRFGTHKMKLMLSQNEPFHPIYDAWQVRSRHILPMDDQEARKKVEMILAKVLSNRKPPYSLHGGLYDAMLDAGAQMYVISNTECLRAAAIFKESEGIDIHPAAAVATASLMDALQKKHVAEDDVIMLNITGGGEERFAAEHPLFFAEPDVMFEISPSPEEVKGKIIRLF
ncbi:MAG: cysteate synthase [Bacteroidales bacterium]